MATRLDTASSRSAAAAIGAVVALVAAYYWSEWRSVSAFVAAMDFGDRLFGDFAWHYYPMGRYIYSLGVPVPGYFYPAFFALVLSPLGLLSLSAAMAVWGVLQAALAVLLCFLCGWKLLDISRRGRVLFVLLFVTSYPLLNNFKWGQTSVLITLCILASVWLYAGGRRVLAAVLLAFAVSIKYYAGVFVLLPLMKRDARFLVAFIAATVLFVCVLPSVALGPAAWLEFERAAGSAIADVGWAASGPNSQYWGHVVLRAAGSGLPAAGARTVLTLTEWLGYLWFGVNVLLIWRLYRREARDALLVSAAIVFLSLPFIVKTSWPHYFVYLPFCQGAILVQLARLGWMRRDLSLVVLLTGVSIILSSVPAFNAFPDWTRYNGAGMLFWSGLSLLVAQYGILARAPLRAPSAEGR
jgi:hypothetical protein